MNSNFSIELKIEMTFGLSYREITKIEGLRNRNATALHEKASF